MNKNKEIIEEENIDQVEIVENSEEYSMCATFDNKKLAKIEKLELNLKHPSNLMMKLRGMYLRQKIVIHEYQELERSVDITHTKGNIKLNLLTQTSVNEIIRKLTPKKREKIRYVYLAGIQILFKSLFKEGIDSPIVISLFDERFYNVKDAHLGTVEGNLAYKKLLFTCYPKYSIDIKDKNFNDALSLHFELLKNKFIKPGNKVMSVYYSALFSLSNTNYGETYSNKPFIEISEECSEISQIREPLLQEINIPDNYKIKFGKIPNLEEGNSSNEEPIPIKYKNNELIVSRARRSFDTSKNKSVSTLKRSSSYIEVKKHAPTLRINGEYFNGIEGIKGPYILIDTGASNSHIAKDKNLNLETQMVEPYEYKNLDGTIFKCNQITIVPIILENHEIAVPCYMDSEMKGGTYHVLLGNSFLDSLEDYKITKEGFEFTNDGEIIFCPKIRDA